MSDQEAAIVIFHEATHVTQNESLPYKEKEYDAYIETAKFNLRSLFPAHAPSFRKNGTLDIDAIKKWVDENYGFTKSEYFTEDSEGPEDKKGPITGWWCCTEGL
ncbi:MAG: hypothetical protein GY795_36925 [Desulfobacterales bacterium]|nr:hypothetical protein [Desulfobacterales bacterium]